MKTEIPGYIHGIWQYAFLTVASLALIAGCTLQSPLQSPSSGNEPPATLYVFNVDPPGRKIAIYQQKWRGPFLGSSTDYIAAVSGQQFVRLSVQEDAFGQTVFFAGQTDIVDRLSSLIINRPVSGETYYAKVRTRSMWWQLASALVGLGRDRYFDFDLISSDEGQAFLRQLKAQDAQPPQNASGGAP